MGLAATLAAVSISLASLAAAGCAAGDAGAPGDPAVDTGTLPSGDALSDVVATDTSSDAFASDARDSAIDARPGSAHGAVELASGGSVSTSSRFRMIATLGPSSMQKGPSTSSKYRLIGGVVGATSK